MVKKEREEATGERHECTKSKMAKGGIVMAMVGFVVANCKSTRRVGVRQ